MNTPTTPPKESPTGPGGEVGDTGHTHEEDPIVCEDRDQRKAFDTLAARAARMGHTFARLGSGYVLSRWGYVRHFTDLAAAQELIGRMEGGEL